MRGAPPRATAFLTRLPLMMAFPLSSSGRPRSALQLTSYVLHLVIRTGLCILTLSRPFRRALKISSLISAYRLALCNGGGDYATAHAVSHSVLLARFGQLIVTTLLRHRAW